MSSFKDGAIGALLFCASLITVLVAGEVIIRTSIFSETLQLQSLRQAWRYARPDYESDFWKLSYMFEETGHASEGMEIHPVTGWAPKSTAANPVGVVGDKFYDLSSLKSPILMYGDSYMAGVTHNYSDRIPQLLDTMLPERDVLNLGVSGYGVDQIYLRMVDTAGLVSNPSIVVGILTDDVNRSILDFRGGQKPRFIYKNDSLVLDNMPILENRHDYIEQHPVSINSYFMRLVLLKLRKQFAAQQIDRLLGYSGIDEEKKIINRKIIENIKTHTMSIGSPLYVVIFFRKEEFSVPDWKEYFLKETLNEYGIVYLDTKEVLRKDMEKTDSNISEYYYEDDGHTNEKGNAVIAQALYEWLGQLEPQAR